jgi:hypothetical protein
MQASQKASEVRIFAFCMALSGIALHSIALRWYSGPLSYRSRVQYSSRKLLFTR